MMGNSAGGNLVYHAGLRATAQVDNLLPLKIRRLILHHPFFGGVKMTESEIHSRVDEFRPRQLTFGSVGEKKRYTVTFVAKKGVKQMSRSEFGSILWGNAQHQVKSPVAFSWTVLMR
ncbi:hypothetical protein Q3G72_000327 [Acer saccharum]|nr:hypothetical protein Q3G72_000327 [Acer saccharum]